MPKVSVHKGVIFIEGTHPKARVIRPVGIELSSFGAQLKSLVDVKNELSIIAKNNGGNCITDFKYGQLARFFAIDDVAFYGKGNLALLDNDLYKSIIEKFN